jgi:hypothetical protein
MVLRLGPFKPANSDQPGPIEVVPEGGGQAQSGENGSRFHTDRHAFALFLKFRPGGLVLQIAVI